MDVLDRLYRRVLDTAGRTGIGSFTTVGELYQSVVPYRAVRGELKIAELAEYEHALLRLITGERDYAYVEEPAILEELRRELSAANPILGVYRDHADAVVRLTRRPPPDETDPAPPPRAADADAGLPLLSAPSPVESAEAVLPSSAVAAAVEPAAGKRREPDSCPACRTYLPADREVRFCPFCGKCLRPVPCAECSSMIEPEWAFCASCGWPRRTSPAVAVPPPEQRLR